MLINILILLIIININKLFLTKQKKSNIEPKNKFHLNLLNKYPQISILQLCGITPMCQKMTNWRNISQSQTWLSMPFYRFGSDFEKDVFLTKMIFNMENRKSRLII